MENNMRVCTIYNSQKLAFAGTTAIKALADSH